MELANGNKAVVIPYARPRRRSRRHRPRREDLQGQSRTYGAPRGAEKGGRGARGSGAQEHDAQARERVRGRGRQHRRNRVRRIHPARECREHADEDRRDDRAALQPGCDRLQRGLHQRPSVASAADELSASVSEVGRQVQESSQIARDAVAQAAKTDERINELFQVSQRIGDVVKVITAIAGADKSARAQRHDRGGACRRRPARASRSSPRRSRRSPRRPPRPPTTSAHRLPECRRRRSTPWRDQGDRRDHRP